MKYSKPLLFGFLLAAVDVVILSMLKMKSAGKINTQWVFLIAFLVYGTQSLIFYKSLNYSSLTVMNLMWDVMSDIMVTMIGFFVFREVLSQKQMLGVVFAFLAILLLK